MEPALVGEGPHVPGRNREDEVRRDRGRAEVGRARFPRARGVVAFEAQQPATAKSKLDGLKAHYNFSQAVESYFEVHSANWHESEKILRQLDALSVDEQAQALVACERMAELLWDALTGIHEATCDPM